MPRNARKKLAKIDLRSLRRINHPAILFAFIEADERQAVNRAKKGLPFANVPDNHGFSLRNSKGSRIVFIHNTLNKYSADNIYYGQVLSVSMSFYLEALRAQAQSTSEIPYVNPEETQEVIQQYNKDFGANLQFEPQFQSEEKPESESVQDPFSNQATPSSVYSETQAPFESHQHVPTFAINSSSHQSVFSTNSSGLSIFDEPTQEVGEADNEVKQIHANLLEDVFSLPSPFAFRLSPTPSEVQASTEAFLRETDRYLSLSPTSLFNAVTNDLGGSSSSMPVLNPLTEFPTDEVKQSPDFTTSLADFDLEFPSSPPLLSTQGSWPNFFSLQRFNSPSSDVSKQEQSYEGGGKLRCLGLGNNDESNS